MTSSSVANRSVVLVDDESMIADVFGQLLRVHLSCPVYTFTQPLAALQELSALNPGIIISDYSMPAMNGLTFLRQAQNIVPDANSVIITGEPIEFLPAELEMVSGLRGVLRKPIHWRSLAEFVVNHWPDNAPPVLHEAVMAG